MSIHRRLRGNYITEFQRLRWARSTAVLYFQSISGSLTPAGEKWVPLSIFPDGDDTVPSTLVSTEGTFYEAINHDPDTVTMPDGSYITSSERADGVLWLSLQNMPSDFISMKNISFNVYIQNKFWDSNDTVTFGIVMYKSDKATTLTIGGTAELDENDIDGLYRLAVNGLVLTSAGYSATKAEWDAALIRLRWDYTTN